ncbi:MAG: hypothetical protein PHP25_02030 [Candidatus Moranbacteria bacterium]|nr:hypothetical protein [Candidatus Moranbacteria bacterium]
MKKYSIFILIALFVLAPVILTGCQNKPEAPREGKFIGVEKIHQKNWRAICLADNGETFEVSVYRFAEIVCGDKKVSGEALFKGEIPEGPLPGYEKEFKQHLEKHPK